jgi:hypothetical protein
LSFGKKLLTVTGRLLLLAVLLAAFAVGMLGVVFYSLSGSVVQVPDLVGKDYFESEKELAQLGLKIKKRAERTSNDKINTILEQLPRPGESVKTGQMILVVVSKLGAPNEVLPNAPKPEQTQDDTEKIEEMISDKPKKARSNSNTNSNTKKADTSRDVISNTATNTSTNTSVSNVTKPDDKATKPGEETKNPEDKSEPKKTQPTPPVPKPSPSGVKNDARKGNN